jgi:RNA 2',3'-cyclic 3'-phosphodiesterase
VTSERTRRLFFALWPDERMQAALAVATRNITGASDGRAIPTANLHLTLAFLGAVPETRIAALSPIAAQVAAAFPQAPERVRGEQSRAPIELTLDTLEHWRKPELLCATASEPAPAAAALSHALKSALVTGGFAPDLKPFRVHATLARKVRRVSGELRVAPVPWRFADFQLIESRTGGSGSASGSSYSTREKWALYESRC